MADIVFKVFFGDKAATRDQLDRLEDITVEQEQDVAWGASVKIPICTDEKGNWADADEKFFASFSRVRVEIKEITGVDVRELAAEIEPTTGTVVKAFTSGTVVQVFTTGTLSTRFISDLASTVTANAMFSNTG